MSAVAELIRAVEERGGSFKVEAGRVRVEAPEPLPDVLLSELRAKRDDLASALSLHRPWDAEDWRAYFEERMAIAVFDGGISELDAKTQALRDAATHWQAMNPLPADPLGQLCAACGGALGTYALPLLARGGHIFVHDGRCHRALLDRRKSEAIVVLKSYGILGGVA
jgi:hypothetical protein